MGILRALSGGLWGDIRRLPPEAKFEMAALIVLYDICRSSIAGRLVEPIARVLAIPVSAEARERMVDEALVAVLRCARVPADGRGVLRFLRPQGLPEFLSTWALADSGDRTGIYDVVTLEQAGYPMESRACARELLSRWAGLLGEDAGQLSESAESAAFLQEWDQFTEAFLGGTLLGMSRQTPDAIFQSRATLIA